MSRVAFVRRLGRWDAHEEAVDGGLHSAADHLARGPQLHCVEDHGVLRQYALAYFLHMPCAMCLCDVLASVTVPGRCAPREVPLAASATKRSTGSNVMLDPGTTGWLTGGRRKCLKRTDASV